MLDVFYFGPKPNLFPFEQPADTLDAAASLTRTSQFWYIDGNNDYTNFDFDYVPVPWQQHFVHVWPNQWQQDGGVYLVNKYTLTDAQHHYHTESPVHRLPNLAYWHIPEWIDPTSIDQQWCPDPCDPPLIYHFPVEWGWDKHSGPEYRVPGATGYKFDTAFVAKTRSDRQCWTVSDNVSDADPTFNWHPDPSEPAYIYVFGNQWYPSEIRESARYTVPGATKIKYVTDARFERVSTQQHYSTQYDCAWDYSWEPDPGDPPYIYVFGNQWYPAEIMPTVTYTVPGATEKKFLDEPRAQLLERHDNHWHTLIDCEWDYSWVPDPGDPPYIYVFGNQWHSAEMMPTVTYTVAGATEKKFLDFPRARLLSDKTNWTIPEEVVESNIDFSWVPDPGSPPYIYHFGTEYQESVGLLYTVPGATEIRLEGPAPRIEQEKTVVDVVDIFFVDRSNNRARDRFAKLEEQYPHIQRIRYANSMMETVKRCIARAKTNKFWVISSLNIYDNFDFSWHAQPWQNYMTHVFGSQWQKWSDTFLISKSEFNRHSKWANDLEEFPNLNFVSNQTVTVPDDIHDIYYVDHQNPAARDRFENLKARHPNIKVTRFVDNYLDTFKRIMSTATTEYVWIASSLCIYDHFDFSWQPEPWQKEMIHCFGTNYVKRGDTFYIHVESFKAQMTDLEMLDWFNVINYCDEQNAPRHYPPVHYYNTDNLVEEIKNYTFETPTVLFTNNPTLKHEEDDLCMWSKKDRVVKRLTAAGASVLVPRDIKAHLVSQIYDYPYINASNRKYYDYFEGKDTTGLDIVYISNGEPDEEKWYEHLCYQSNTEAKWVRGVNGRTAAYQEAARQSTTPWFFAVFAKLEVEGGSFPWTTWMPDYFQQPKHYIFNSRNPVNGLEYGHQGMIAYNKNLVLANNNPGIDFTLTQPHESVPILSGVAHFNQDAWMTWRTAFREVVKLKHYMATQPTLATEDRLNVWLNRADPNAAFADWCLKGAADAVEYYESVNGDYDKLLFSFEWAWLRAYFDAKY